MIQLSSHIYTPTTGVGPFTWQWSSSNPCVSFSYPSGTVDAGGSFETVIYVDSTTCFQYGIDSIVLTMTDSKGCSTPIMFYPTDPCDSLELTNIGRGPGEFDFSVTAFGGVPKYNFSWSVTPAGVFSPYVVPSLPSTNGFGTIHLTPLEPSTQQPTYFTIHVTATDANGCRRSTSQSFPLQGAYLHDVEFTADCIQPGNGIPKPFSLFKSGPINNQPIVRGFSAGPMVLTADANTTCMPDWSTLNFSLPDTDIQYNVHNTPLSTTVTFYGIKESSFQNNTMYIPFTVKDCKGALSNEAIIVLHKGECGTLTGGTCPLIVNNLCIQDCDPTFTINLEDLIISPNCCSTNGIDWSTFQIVPGTPADPATVEFNGATHTLTYTDNGSDLISDLIEWSISDTLGNNSGIKYIQIARKCPAPPSCTDDCYYASTNAVDFPLNVLGNDLGPNLKPSTLQITQIPDNGTAYVFDGDIYYTPFAGFEGVDTLMYKVYDSNGNYCTSLVTITVAADGPAGTGNNIITCSSPIPIYADIHVNPGVSLVGEFELVLTSYNDVDTPLDVDDEIDIDIIVSGTTEASATLLVGSDYTTTVKTGTDNNWLTDDNFAQYLNSATLDAATLVTGQTITFNKHDWAWDKGYINTYEDTVHGGTTTLAAKEIVVRIKARSIANATESAFSSDIVEKVKIFAFEDTSHISGAADDSNNAGFWEPYSANPATPDACGCNGNCGPCNYHSITATHLWSWYSDATPPACTHYGLKRIVTYKIVGSPEVTGQTIDFTTEAEILTALNGIQPWGTNYHNWDYWTSGTNDYNLWGHQAQYVSSKYLLASTPELDYFVIEYQEDSDAGNQAKCTTVSHILF